MSGMWHADMIRKTFIAICLVLALATIALGAVSFWTDAGWSGTVWGTPPHPLRRSDRAPTDATFSYVVQDVPKADSVWCQVHVRYGRALIVALDSDSPFDLAVDIGSSRTMPDRGTLSVFGSGGRLEGRWPSDFQLYVGPKFPRSHRYGPQGAYVRLSQLAFPLWAPLAAFLLYPGIVLTRARLRQRHRRRKGVCLACGYNLAGNVTGRCPECGTPISQVTLSSQGDA